MTNESSVLNVGGLSVRFHNLPIGCMYSIRFILCSRLVSIICLAVLLPVCPTPMVTPGLAESVLEYAASEGVVEDSSATRVACVSRLTNRRKLVHRQGECFSRADLGKLLIARISSDPATGHLLPGHRLHNGVLAPQLC
jgi:hypothetical protein